LAQRFTDHRDPDAIQHRAKESFAKRLQGGEAHKINELEWLTFVGAYRTLCLAPPLEVRSLFSA